MKYRKHFVTNSSSSCFIAVYQGEETCLEELKKKNKRYRRKEYVVGKRGSLEFEGHLMTYKDFDSRLNFVCLTLLQYGIDLENHPMGVELYDLFEEKVGIPLNTNYIAKLYYDDKAHIDHESLSTDSIIFQENDSMEKFLFGKKSLFIQGWDTIEGEDEKYCNNPEYKTEFI